MPIVCNVCKPFMVATYCLQQRYLPYKPQISGLPPWCHLLIAIIVLCQKMLSIIETKNKEKIFYCFYRRNNKLLYKT
jgi:hypothetical protein